MVVLKINTAKKKRETGLPSRTAKRMWSGAFPAFPESQSTQTHTHTHTFNQRSQENKVRVRICSGELEIYMGGTR